MKCVAVKFHPHSQQNVRGINYSQFDISIKTKTAFYQQCLKKSETFQKHRCKDNYIFLFNLIVLLVCT